MGLVKREDLGIDGPVAERRASFVERGVWPRCRDVHDVDGHVPRDIELADAPVRIEDDAWIAAGSIILRGTTIGRGAIVGAGSVVTRDVAPMTVVAGNPARMIRRLDT